jgi:hypothetical protein
MKSENELAFSKCIKYMEVMSTSSLSFRLNEADRKNVYGRQSSVCGWVLWALFCGLKIDNNTELERIKVLLSG